MPIVKKNLSEQIYDSLKADIYSQRISLGEKLINRELQKLYGVSSTPVRDAINKLHKDGLLEDISNVGARVIKFDRVIAAEVNEIVALLNSDALKLTVVKNNQDAVIKNLNAVIKNQEKHLNDSEYLEYDKQFHHTFFDYCENSRLATIYQEHDALWDMLILIYHQNSLDLRHNAIKQHKAILNAYANKEYEKAQHLISTHFLDVFSDLKV